MEIRKYLGFIFILTGITLVPVFVNAYDAETTHPALTKEIVELFNYYHSDLKFSDKERDLLMLGSTKEDDPVTRCVNHFYDPIYNDGLTVGISLGLDAKDWSQNTKNQMGALNVAGVGLTKDLFSANSDYSWERAIYDYAHNDKERALESLGHILHLIQDMSVPPHTRNDDHISGRDDSPYETYTSSFNKDNIKDISSSLENEEEIILSDIGKYFNSLASFTNNNFFSKDTVDNEIRFRQYAEPVVDFEKEEYIEGLENILFGYKNLEGDNFKLVGIKRAFIKNKKNDTYFIKGANDLILQDYWQILSKQAVLYGAGVIKLFFDEVEKEKETLALLEKNKSSLNKLASNIKNTTSSITGFFSEAFANVNKSVAQIDRMDLVANIKDGSENEGEGFAPALRSFSEEGAQNPPNNEPSSNNNEPKPEDPNSPELQRLALILREAERMLVRTGKQINNLEGQNVGGSIGNLILGAGDAGPASPAGRLQSSAEPTPEADRLAKTNEEENKEEEQEQVQTTSTSVSSGGGGGGGGATLTGGQAATQTQTQASNSTATSSITISPPQITSPTDLTQTFTSSSIAFSGTASSTQTISTDFSSATTTTNSSNIWNLNLTGFITGTTTINFYASDNLGNISQATTKTIYINTFTPDVSLSISQCDNSILNSSCLIASTTLNILWSTTAQVSDFAYFNIDKNGTFSTTTATSTQITNLNDGDIYNFSVVSVANNGNTSATSTKQVEINTMPIVINEIAWAGTSASTDDEWIELYNRSGEDIDLTDWFLYSADGAPDLSFSNATDKVIEANSYYLIERTDDTTVNDITADFVTPFSGAGTSNGLNNTGEHLILAYKKSEQATTTIDQAPFGSGWPTGDGYRTLERYNPDYLCNGVEDCRDNWGLSIGQYILNGYDAGGIATIKGTPKARNSINHKITKGNILTEDKTITKANSPYFVGSDGLTIQSGKTLTIEEGVIIKTINRSGDAEIIVNGTIKANGSVSEPIIFTSFTDDIGGDTNGDGVFGTATATTTTAVPGEANNFWSQIILPTGSLGSLFNHTVFKYGGYRLGTTYPKAMVILNNAQANFDNVTVENSRGSGLSLNTSTSTISNSTIQNNYKRQSGDNEDFYGVYALRGQVEVNNSSFDNNQIGIGFFDTLGSSVSDNNFTNHEGFPLIMNGSSGFSLVNNSGSGNDKNGIQVCGYITKIGFDTTLVQNPLPYLVEKSIEVIVGTSLSISSGSVFKFKQYNINVAGELNVNGVAGNPVIFTSADDDSDGIDVYGNGVTATSSISKIGGINLHSATSTIENAEFRYLDRATAYYDTYGVQSPINLKNVIYSYNTWSIFVDNQTVPVTRNENVQFVGIQSMSVVDNW